MQIDVGAQPASYQMDSGGISQGAKRPGREANISPPLAQMSSMCGVIPPLPNTSSWYGT